VATGWNLVSVPVTVTDLRTTVIFPSAASQAYEYDPDGYLVRDTLAYGHGYWLKFDSAATVLFGGAPREADTVDIPAGWSMLGSISYAVDTDSILQIPPGNVQAFFRFQPGVGYLTPADILPGEAVWVRATQAGQLILRRQGVAR